MTIKEGGGLKVGKEAREVNEVQAFNWKTRTRNHGHVGTIIAVFCDPDRLYVLSKGTESKRNGAE